MPTTQIKQSPEQQANLTAIVLEAHARGITNPYAIASILSIVNKESGFHLHAEGSYAHTDNARIRKIFGNRVAMFNEAQLSVIKTKDIEFFDYIYGYKSELGRKNGNTLPGDGWKYRGHGYNQTTFKNTLIKIGKQIGVDLISDPSIIETPKVGAKVVVQYFINAFAAAPKSILAEYHSSGINDFKSLPDSIGAFYHANAGWGHSVASLQSDPTGGLKKAKDYSSAFYEFVSQNKAAVASGGGAFFFTDGISDGNISESEQEKETTSENTGNEEKT